MSEEYRLRTCAVEQDEAGRTWLEIHAGNLVATRGVVWDDGAVLRFEGWLTDRKPFGCNTCQDRCFINPGSCGCSPMMLDPLGECLAQPVHGELRGGGGSFRGTLSYDHYWNEYEGEGESRHVSGHRTTRETQSVTLVR